MRQMKFSGLNNLQSRIWHFISKSLCQCGQTSGGCRRTPQNFNRFLCSFILSCSSASFILFFCPFAFQVVGSLKMQILSDYYPDCISKDPFFLIWTLVEMESNRDIFKSFSNACGRQTQFSDHWSDTVFANWDSFSYSLGIRTVTFLFFSPL